MSHPVIAHPLRQVYPSTEASVFALEHGDGYGGAHDYEIITSRGIAGGRLDLTGDFEGITFLQKRDLGNGNVEVRPGLQSEQLLIVLIDRHKKLDAVFPCKENKQLIGHLEAALGCIEARVRDRLERGVAGQLKQ